MEGLGYLKASINTYVPVLVFLALRVLLFRKNMRRLAGLRSMKNGAPHILSLREFAADFVTWLLIGLCMGAVYILYFQAPILTGIKVLLGCVCFGLFGGMLCFLTMEKKIMNVLNELKYDTAFSPKRVISVSKKMLFFMVTVLVVMVIVALLMVYMDINYLLTHREAFGADIYVGVFKEILFAFVVLLLLSLLILGQYSRNLRSILSLQLRVMDDISQGNYDTRVPVVSNDEFGLIAAKTNEMIRGLREKEICEISFGRYVTPEVSEMILKGEISPDGELKEVTILFCDLRGYTPFVERRRPKEVVDFLNEYFSEMEKAVKEHQGIVLQYIGDEIEAVFGAPVALADHPDMAVMAALEMRNRLRDLNRRRVSIGESPIEHGIGVHSGEVLAGSVGSPDRLVYAMVGDTVNIASRIQTLNKQFGTDILVSKETKALLRRKEFDLAGMGEISLKGKTEKVGIYKVL